MNDLNTEYNNPQNFKVILTGDSGVGKTSIVDRYTKNTFKENIMSTAGVSFTSKILEFPDIKKNCKLDVNLLIYNIIINFSLDMGYSRTRKI